MTTAAPPSHPSLSAAVPLSKLDPHPLNPRPPAKPEELRELVASILSQGLIVPLVVRPLRGDGTPGELGQAAARYQVLAGHRRLEALREVALTGTDRQPQEQLLDRYQVAVLVRPCTDVQALEVVLAENAHHRDVDPFMEGEAVDACLDAHEGDVRAVAAALGVSVRWVAVRRGLKNLSRAWQERLRNMEPFRSWPLYVAELLAGLAPDAQDRLFREESKLLDVAGGPPSRTWWELRVAERTRELGRAPFDVTDATLVTAAGPCTTCPFTSAAQPGLFDDGKPEGDVKLSRCLNSPCWDRKVAVHTRLALEAARQRYFDQGGLPGLPLAILPQDEVAATAPKGCGVVLARHEYVRAREGDKGAVPALEVVGKVDRLVWVKPTPAGDARLAPRAKKPKADEPEGAAPLTLEQQLRQLEDQHLAKVEGAAVLELLGRMRKRAPASSLQQRLAAIFGATPALPVPLEALVKLDRTGKAPDLWPAVVQAVDSTLAHAPDPFWRKAAPLVAKVQGIPWPKLLEQAGKAVKPSTELLTMRATGRTPDAPSGKPAWFSKLDRKARRKAKAMTAAPGAGKAKPRRTAEQLKAQQALEDKLAARKGKPARGPTLDGKPIPARIRRTPDGGAEASPRKPARRTQQERVAKVERKPRAAEDQDAPLAPRGGLKPDVVSDALTLAACPDGKARDGGEDGRHLKLWTDAELSQAYDWAMREHLGAAGNGVKRRPCPEHVLALAPLDDVDQQILADSRNVGKRPAVKPGTPADLRKAKGARQQARPGARKAKPAAAGKALEVSLNDGGKGQDEAQAATEPTEA